MHLGHPEQVSANHGPQATSGSLLIFVGPSGTVPADLHCEPQRPNLGGPLPPLSGPTSPLDMYTQGLGPTKTLFFKSEEKTIIQLDYICLYTNIVIKYNLLYVLMKGP